MGQALQDANYSVASKAAEVKKHECQYTAALCMSLNTQHVTARGTLAWVADKLLLAAYSSRKLEVCRALSGRKSVSWLYEISRCIRAV